MGSAIFSNMRARRVKADKRAEEYLKKRKKEAVERRNRKSAIRRAAVAAFAVFIGGVAYFLVGKREKTASKGVGNEQSEEAALRYVVSFPHLYKEPSEVDIGTPMRAFSKIMSEKEVSAYRRNYVVFQAKKGADLVASVFIRPVLYRGSDPGARLQRPICEVYNVYVSPKHRGKKRSVTHIKEALSYVQWVYDIPDTSLVGLHISPKDRMMEKAYALYRTSGFVKGSFSTDGPPDYRERCEELDRMEYADDAIEKHPYFFKKYYGRQTENGEKYFCMFTPLREFYRAAEKSYFTKEDYLLYLKQGQRLRRMLESLYRY